MKHVASNVASFHDGFFAKVLVEKSRFGVLSSASSPLARRCSYGGIRQGIGFNPHLRGGDVGDVG